jgi:hypothetical protein
MATNCIYRSVSLQVGESFTLPPGAEIVSATDLNSITSTCPLPDNLEALECYIFVLLAADPISSGRGVWSGGSSGDENAFILTLTVGGVTYNIPDIPADSNGIFDVGQLASVIASNPSINGMMLSLGVASGSDPASTRGGVGTLCFKTTPSIAADTYLQLNTSLFNVGTPEPTTLVRLYPKKLSDYAGGVGTCTCAAST